MDSLPRPLMHSLQFRLAAWILGSVLLCAAAATGLAFTSALDEAQELQDDVMRQVAYLLQQGRLPVPTGSPATGPDVDEMPALIVEMLGRQGALPLPASLHDGMLVFLFRRHLFRVLVATLPGGEHVAIAQETRLADEAARESALRTSLPFLLLAPLLLLVMAMQVRTVLRPIPRLTPEPDRDLGREEATRPTAMQAVFQRVLEDLLPWADLRGVDVGAEGHGNAWVRADEADLVLILRGFAHHAVRQTPQGGRVDLAARVGPQAVEITITGTAPALPAEAHGRMFESVPHMVGADGAAEARELHLLRAMAERMGAVITLQTATPGSCKGPGVVVSLPSPETVAGTAGAGQRGSHVP